MGWTSYSVDARSYRASTLGYDTKTSSEIFTQSKVQRIHESMNPSKSLIRESRDSDNHPNSVPIIIALDTTGSMGSIPLHLVRDGLPKMVGNIIQHGVPDPQILFLGVGDHECDNAPLQVGQFESGDEELDLWLTRTWLEGNGGGNNGESYHLAWYFAANHTIIDSFEKRGQKGLLFTIGDEPCLKSLPIHSVNEIMGGNSQKTYTEKELLEMAQEKYDVYHLHIMEGSAGRRSLSYWKELLGQRCIQIDDHKKVADVISEIVVSNRMNNTSYQKVSTVIDGTTSHEEVL